MSSESLMEDSSIEDSPVEENLTFQVTDWSTYHEEETVDGKDVENYTMRIYGTTEEGKKIYVQADGFQPYFFVKVPSKWRISHVNKFVDGLKYKIWPEICKNALVDYKLVKKCIFDKDYGFTNYKKFRFVKLIFNSHNGYKRWARVLRSPVELKRISSKPVQYDLFESNIEPFFRCMHIQDLKSTGWINIKKYRKFPKQICPSNNDINVQTEWDNLEPVDKNTIGKLIISSFDIECFSPDLESFPERGNPECLITQIGTTSNRYGEPECFKKYIAVVGKCDDIPGAQVESFGTEAEMLIGWAKHIRKINPDIMTGYNIFGFDYRYIRARVELLNISERFDRIISRLNHESAVFVDKILKSAALGDNYMYYYDIPGRVQIDLMKVVMRDHKLTSYKLDHVASHFINEDVVELKVNHKKNRTLIKTKQTYGLEVGRFIKICYNDGLSDDNYNDGEKFKILKLTEDSILVQGVMEGEALKYKTRKTFWCMAKDDITLRELFAKQVGTPKEIAEVAAYCIQDCALCNKIMEKLQILTCNIEMANLNSVPLSYIFLRGQGVKIYSLTAKKCRLRDHLVKVHHREYTNDDEVEGKRRTVVEYIDNSDPQMSGFKRKKLGKKFGKQMNKDEERKAKEKALEEARNAQMASYEGATVLLAHPGVYYTPISVLDYGSLYPSSMIHRNLSHECQVLDPKYDNLPGYYYYNTKFYNGDGSSTECRWAKSIKGLPGIVPEILTDLLTERKRVKKLLKAATDPFTKKILDAQQLACKLTANSFYGQTGAAVSPIYCRNLAASTTSTGREMLHSARIFQEVIFRKLVRIAQKRDYLRFAKLMRQFFTKKIEKMIGSAAVDKMKKSFYKDNDDPKDKTHLKRANDYFYLGVLNEKKTELDDKAFVNEKKGIFSRDDYIKKTYDDLVKIMDSIGPNSTVTPFCAYGDTDSIFVNFQIRGEGEKKDRTDHNALVNAIKLGVLSGDLINMIMPHPQVLEYEKTYWPWIILSKKRYVGNKYEFNPDEYVFNCMGVALKRRDYSVICKIMMKTVIMAILQDRSSELAVKRVNDTLRQIFLGKFPIEKFVLSKTLKGPDSYKNRSTIMHCCLADRIAIRDPGNCPQANDRVQFVFIEVDERKVSCMGDRIETPEYVLEKKLKIDYIHYISNQVMIPVNQILELICKDPTKLFMNHIIIAQNKRNNVRPIAMYMKMAQDKMDNSDSDDEDDSWNVGLKCDEEKQVAQITKPKKKMNRKKKKVVLVTHKIMKSKGGFMVDY